MSRALPPGWFRKQFRWLRWALGACAVAATITAITWFATPWYVRTRLLPDLWAQFGLTLTAERRDLSITDGTAEFYGVRIFDGEDEILTAKRMAARASLRGLYEGCTIFERFVLEDPVVHARLEADGRTNLGRILERKADSATPPPAILWEEAFVHGGTIEWEDPSGEVRLRILDLEASVLDVQTGSGRRLDRFGQITIDANLEQPDHELAPLSIVYWRTPSADTAPSFVVHTALTGIDLDSFPRYVDAGQRASLGVDHLDLAVSMEVREGIIRRGAAVAISPERTRPLTLLFGGPFEDPVFDRLSKLNALFELPFARLGRVGDVVWETGSAVVGGVVGVIDGIVHGDPLGAGQSAAEGVGQVGMALGSNTLDTLEYLGRALGLVAEEEARDIAAIHAHQRELFIAARHEAARKWSSADAEDSEQPLE